MTEPAASPAQVREAPRVGRASWTLCAGVFLASLAAALLVIGQVCYQEAAIDRAGGTIPVMAAVSDHPDFSNMPRPALYELRRWIALRLNAAFEAFDFLAYWHYALLAPLLVALLSLPNIATGDKRRALVGRAVRSALGASLAVPLLLVAAAFVAWWWPAAVLVGWMGITLSSLWPLAAWLLLTTCVNWRARPAEFPLLARPLACNRCGYALVGLPETGRCPECGRGVSESLPQARALPAWETARWYWRPLTWLAALAQVLVRRDSFCRLAVPPNAARAALFSDLCAVLLGVYGAARLMWQLEEDLAAPLPRLLVAVGLALPIALLCVQLVRFLLALPAIFRAPAKFLRRSVAIAYATPFWLPLGVVGIEYLFTGSDPYDFLPRLWPAAAEPQWVSFAVLVCLAAVAAAFAILKTLAAIRDMRLAMPAGVSWNVASGDWERQART